MIASKEYARGFNAGLNAGIKKGVQMKTNLKHDVMIDNDLIMIYGMMCLWLKNKFGYSTEQIEEACIDIQEMWSMFYDDMMAAKAEGKPAPFLPDIVEKETGVALAQVFNAEEDVEALREK